MPADTGPITTQPENMGFFGTLGGLWGDFEDWAKDPDNQNILTGGGSAIIANVLKNKGLLDSSAEKIGYQGKIPEYTARRAPIQYAYDPNRRPGSAGRRYFSDIEYIPGSGGVASVVQPELDVNPGVTNPGGTPPQLPDTPSVFDDGDYGDYDGPTGLPDTLFPYDDYVGPREGDVKEEPTGLPDTLFPYDDYVGPREGDVKEEPTPLPPPEVLAQNYAEGGIAQLSEGRYLKGETDGMADEVPASIDGQEPAALSDGEFVIPADIVSHLGNGNSEAGAKALKEMMSRIRGERTGNNEQGKQIDPNNFLLA